MEIVNGFGRFTTGEQVEVEVEDVWYTKKGKPCLKMRNTDGETFSNNILEKYEHLRGRCLLTCTGLGDNNFPFINLKKLQDSSWDVHDEVKSSPVDDLTQDIPEVLDHVELEDVLYSILLTRQFDEKLRFHNDIINKHIQALLDELHAECGRKYTSTMGEDYELS